MSNCNFCWYGEDCLCTVVNPQILPRCFNFSGYHSWAEQFDDESLPKIYYGRRSSHIRYVWRKRLNYWRKKKVQRKRKPVQVDVEDQYVNEIKNLEENGVYDSMQGLAKSSTYNSHVSDGEDPLKGNNKKVLNEVLKEIPKSLCLDFNGSIFFRFDEDNPRFIRALLTGLSDTPYDSGLFLFDIYLSHNYPQKPPMIKHITRDGNKIKANNGPGGFSPNLHSSTGTVCLSLLGTWSGPGWQKDKSNVYQILSTILYMIFGAKHPYYMEPSYGGWEGTVDVNKENHERAVFVYDEMVMLHNVKHCMIELVKDPYPGFEEVIKKHFKIKKDYIVKTVQKWLENEKYENAFKEKLKALLDELKDVFNAL